MDDDHAARRWRRRAEWAVARPGMHGVGGRLREEVQALKGEALADRRAADEALASAIRRRQEAERRIRALNVALRGTGVLVGADGSERRVLRKRGYAEPDPLPRPGATGLRGARLRAVLVELLSLVAGEPLRPRDLHRLLLAHGYEVAGRPSQTIVAALAVEVAQGRVARVGHGRYVVP